MEAFLEEIQATLDCGIWSTALMSAIMIPDACGAIEYPLRDDGTRRGNRDRYTLWYNNFVNCYELNNITFNGDVVWKIRNGMLHETMLSLNEYGFDRVLFTVPDGRGSVLHMNTMEMDGGTALNVDLTIFCQEIIAGARGWLNQIAAEKSQQLERLVQYRPQGLTPFIVGVPLVA